MPRRAASRGVTLVELLVSVTIGLALTLVIAQLFLNTRQTFATTDDVSRMQENIRFSQQMLIRTIHLAGYKSQPNSITANVFDAGNQAIQITDFAGAQSDELTIRYQGSGDGSSPANCATTSPFNCTGADGTILDCVGNRVDAKQMAVSTFTIRPGANGSNALFCQVPGGNPVEMVSDVAFMRILLGEDTDGDLTTNRYVSAATAGLIPNNVLTVRIALLFQTPSKTSKAVPDPASSYKLNDVTLTGPPYTTDRRIRRAVTTTINLRNRTP